MTAQLWSEEAVVNANTGGDQARPHLVVLTDGTFVIVWQDFFSGGGEIRARRFFSDGTPVGEELIVNSDPVGAQLNPSVAALANGGFAVIWHDGPTLERRLFDADNVPVGPDQGVFSPGAVIAQAATVGVGPDLGRVDVVSLGGEITQIRWGANGQSLGFSQVNSSTVDAQVSPDIAVLTSGRYVVTWATTGLSSPFGVPEVRARIFQDGAPMGADFVVNGSQVSGGDHAPKITALETGGFVVVWRSGLNAFPGQGVDIRGRMFDGAGSPVGAEFLVNTPTAGSQSFPEVVGLKDGGFMAFWFDEQTGLVRGQQFDAFGGRVGSSLVVSTDGAPAAGEDALTAGLLADGRVAVAWESGVVGKNVHMVIVDPRQGVVEGGAGDDVLHGGHGADQIIALGGADYVRAGGGDDAVHGGAGEDLLLGEAGDDLLHGQNGSDTLWGAEGDDSLRGGAADDYLVGGAGADQMVGGEGVDTAAYAGGGAVALNLTTGVHTGDAAGDAFFGVERILLSYFDDAAIGSWGGDFLDGWGGADVLNGGLGGDTLLGGEGADKLSGEDGADSLDGGADADLLWGGTDSDVVDGGIGADKLYGGAGSDALVGSSGNDLLLGEDGDDTLTGGLGADQLTGGAGADVFRFLALGDSTVVVVGRDAIKDFSAAQGDKIDLSGVDAITDLEGSAPFNDAFTFVAKFTGTAGQLRVSTGGGGTVQLVQGDVNGDGVADFAIHVAGGTPLTAADFIL